MFTSGLTLAPALTSVLLMPTFASTPTLGLTLVESVFDEDCAKAGPNAPITAAAVILNAKFRSLILSPFVKVTPFPRRKSYAGRQLPHISVDNLPT
jgi:hypothetical protein